MGTRGIGLPSAKLSFHPGGKTTLPLKEVVYEAGIEREGVDPDIDPGKKAENLFESQYGYTSGEELVKHAQQRLDEIAKAQGKAVRKDAVPLCATIIKPHSAMIKPLLKEEQEALCRAAVEELQVIIGSRILKAEGIEVSRDAALEAGKKATVMVAYHFDEGAPHAHVMWEPILWKDEVPRTEAKLHDKKFLGELNRELPKAMNRRGYDFKLAFDYLQATDEEKKAHADVPSGMSTMEYKAMRREEAERRLKEVKVEVEKLEQKQSSLIENLDVGRSELAHVKAEKASMEEELAEAKDTLTEAKALSEVSVLDRLRIFIKGKHFPQVLEDFALKVVDAFESLDSREQAKIKEWPPQKQNGRVHDRVEHDR